jgi:alkanesulfonate monooxygenase SsuD/methylene tetrahydromethanopterin reductase-like flavin-dependent oxidoreductase (luciferase family)
MGPHYRGFVARFGFEAEVEHVRATWAAGREDEARAAVTDSMVNELAVAGTPEACRVQLARVRAAGADLPILFFPGSCSNRMVELALNTMATPASTPAPDAGAAGRVLPPERSQ